MKIKRDPESMKAVRQTLAMHPGWISRAKLDAMSDDELADLLDRSFTALQDWVSKCKTAMEEASRRISLAVEPAVRAAEELREAQAKRALSR